MKKRRVIPKADVVPWPVLLDQGVLKNQGLFLRSHLRHIHAGRHGHQMGNHRALVVTVDVLGDSALQVLGLSHVDHTAAAILKQIHAGTTGQVPRGRIECIVDHAALLVDHEPIRVLEGERLTGQIPTRPFSVDLNAQFV